jgi:hypothetical protein
MSPPMRRFFSRFGKRGFATLGAFSFLAAAAPVALVALVDPFFGAMVFCYISEFAISTAIAQIPRFLFAFSSEILTRISKKEKEGKGRNFGRIFFVEENGDDVEMPQMSNSCV